MGNRRGLTVCRGHYEIFISGHGQHGRHVAQKVARTLAASAVAVGVRPAARAVLAVWSAEQLRHTENNTF